MEAQQPVQGFGEYPGLPPFFVPEPPEKPKIDPRYIVGALAVFAVGLAAAAFSFTTTSSSAAAPEPIPTSQAQDEAARAIWRTTPVEKLFPERLHQTAADPSDQYVRLGVATPAGCDVLPQTFRTALTTAAPGTRCVTVLQATYTDATRTVLATVGVVVVDGTATARDQVWRKWTPDSDAKKLAMMPGVFRVDGTVAAKFTDAQRITWNSEPTDDGAFIAYVVTAFADGRAGSTQEQLAAGTDKALATDSPPVQAAIDLLPDYTTLLGALEKDGKAS